VKVEWLNDQRTFARVSRGWFWWRRVAVLYRSKTSNRDQDPIYWAYEISDRFTSARIDRFLERERNWYPADWRKVGDGAPLPAARILDRKATP
jgi:hypothetical protein